MVGTKWKEEYVVQEKDSAQAMKSGELNVFSTPSMIALMEYTSWKAIAEKIEKTQTTVGININVDHLKPTQIGKTVNCVSEVVEFDGKKIIFKVEVFDEKNEIIGKGFHTRFIVDKEKFMKKLESN